MARWKLTGCDIIIIPLSTGIILFLLLVILNDALKFSTTIFAVLASTMAVASGGVIPSITYAIEQQKEKDNDNQKINNAIDPYMSVRLRNTLRLTILLGPSLIFVLSNLVSLLSGIPINAPGPPKPVATGSYVPLVSKSKPIADVLNPSPTNKTLLLAGLQVQSKVYAISAKNCPDSTFEALANLDGMYSTGMISFSLDDNTASFVRMSVSVRIDGQPENTKIISARESASFELNTRGVRNLVVIFSTLGQSNDTCADSKYYVAVNGTIIP